MSTETVSNIQNPYRLIPRFLTLYKNTFLQFFFLSWVGKYGEWISPNCGKKGGAGQNTFQSLYSYSRHSSSIVYPLTNIMTTVSLHLESSMLNIASNPCFALNVLLPLLSSPLLSLLQAFSATVGQIHTWLQHLQLCRGLARCNQDEPVQRQLPQLRLYLPAAGGSNDLRVSSPAHAQNDNFQKNPIWHSMATLIRDDSTSSVRILSMNAPSDSSLLTDCIKVKAAWVMHKNITHYYRK